VRNAVAVCGTALTPEHLELLERCDCREVVILFDGDLAGLAAPAKAAQVLLPSSVSGKVAVLPSDAGKVDPDDFARARGKEGVEALLASAVPLTDFLIGRAVDRHCAGNAADAPVEAKLAAVRELAPLVRLAPEGLSRTTFEERIARRMELDLQALRDEILGRPRAAPAGVERRARPPAGPRATLLLPGPAVDALGILVGHPALGPVAAEEDLARLFPEGPLAELVRDLCRDAVPLDAVLARLEPAVDPRVGQRVKALAGPAAPHAADAEREFRRAVIEAKIEGVRRELSRLEALVARVGAAGADDSTVEYLTLQRRRLDLERRREELRRS
jgi:DNA primase